MSLFDLPQEPGTATFEWKVEQTSDGVFVTETLRLSGEESASKRFGPLNDKVIDTFIRGRRRYVAEQMSAGGNIRLLFH